MLFTERIVTKLRNRLKEAGGFHEKIEPTEPEPFYVKRRGGYALALMCLLSLDF